MTALLPQNLEFPPVPVGAWLARPFQLITLWDMIQTEVWHLVNHASTIERFQNYLEECRKDDLTNTSGHYRGEFDADKRESATVIINLVEPWLKALKLDASLDRLDRIRDAMDGGHDEFATTDLVAAGLQTFRETLEDELKRRVFFYMPHDDASYYRQQQLFGSKVWGSFPSSRNDVMEAGNCFATGRYTACAFHCARVAEKGLHALAHDMNSRFGADVSFGDKKIERAQWGTLIEKIESEIRSLINPNRKPRLNPDDTVLYSQAAKEFTYLKNGWRDEIAHSRLFYERAADVRPFLDHVQSFMTYLAEEGLTEPPKEADNPLPEN